MKWLTNLLLVLSVLDCATAVTVLSGASVTITCSLATTLPAWSYTDSAGTSQDITLEGINSILAPFTFMSYASNNKDLFIDSVNTSFAGNYTCSISTGGGSSATFTLEVDVLTVNREVWPETNGSFAFIATSCQSGASVKWFAVFPTKDNTEIEMCVTSTENATSCDTGKEQLSTGFDYRPGKKLEVKFKYKLLHSSTGNTPQATATSDSFEIYGCCLAAEVVSYIFFTTTAITTLATAGLSFKYLKVLGTIGKVFIGVACISLAGDVGWFIALCVSVLPVLPGEGEGCLDLTKGEKCKCGHPIAFAVVSSILTCAGGAMIVYIIYKIKQPRGGGTPTATPAPPDRARGNAGGRQENGRKKETKFKPQDSPENDDTERKRPLPGPPKDEPQMQGKNVLPRIETKKSQVEPEFTPRPLPPIKRAQE